VQVEKRIIVALDGISRADSLAMAAELKDLVWGFKVNDLLVECGVEIVSQLKEYGNVFADAKLHDIPNTVANGVKRLEAAGADLITIHASGGPAMIAAAAGAAENACLLTVTVLTSLGDEDSQSIFGRTSKEAVISFARLAGQHGAGGIVCSAKELEFVEQEKQLKTLLKVIPGIRPRWYGTSDDQKRTKSPADAIRDGADLLVIGRPITKHSCPAEAAELVLKELAD
jgi:orotidine-5'-phosphate decarboxylase